MPIYMYVWPENYNVYHIFAVSSQLQVSITSPRFVALHLLVSEIVCLILFYKNYRYRHFTIFKLVDFRLLLCSFLYFPLHVH